MSMPHPVFGKTPLSQIFLGYEQCYEKIIFFRSKFAYLCITQTRSAHLQLVYLLGVVIKCQFVRMLFAYWKAHFTRNK